MILMLKTIQVKSQSQRLKEVQCEQCGMLYAYRMTRSAIGQALGSRNVYLSNLKAVTAQAKQRSMALLDKKLENDADLVPCPACQWVNRRAIRAYGRHRYGFRAFIYVLVFLLSTPIMCLFGPVLSYPVLMLLPAKSPWIPTVMMLAILLSLGLPVLGMFLWTQFQRRRVRPNQFWPDGPPVIPVDTPAALLPVDVDDQGAAVYEPVDPFEAIPPG